MALEDSNTVDAIGVENDTGHLVLTIADSWSWDNEGVHLLALQSKLNTYFDFIESGQLLEEYPGAVGRSVVIDIIGKYPLPQIAIELLRRASDACVDLGVTIRSQYWSGAL